MPKSNYSVLQKKKEKKVSRSVKNANEAHSVLPGAAIVVRETSVINCQAPFFPFTPFLHTINTSRAAGDFSIIMHANEQARGEILGEWGELEGCRESSERGKSDHYLAAFKRRGGVTRITHTPRHTLEKRRTHPKAQKADAGYRLIRSLL